MTVIYDPSRHTPEFKKHMESRATQRAHDELFARMRRWKKDYREWWMQKEAEQAREADEQ